MTVQVGQHAHSWVDGECVVYGHVSPVSKPLGADAISTEAGWLLFAAVEAVWSRSFTVVTPEAIRRIEDEARRAVLLELRDAVWAIPPQWETGWIDREDVCAAIDARRDPR